MVFRQPALESLGTLAKNEIPGPHPRPAKLESVISVYFNQREQALRFERPCFFCMVNPE